MFLSSFCLITHITVIDAVKSRENMGVFVFISMFVCVLLRLLRMNLMIKFCLIAQTYWIRG